MAKTQEELLEGIYNRLGENNKAAGGNGSDMFNSSTSKGSLAMAGFEKVTGGLSSLASGTANMSQVVDVTTGFISQFGGAGKIAGTALNELGQGVINVNNTLKQTGQFGITFGNDLGGFNAAVKNGHLTMEEFREIAAKGSTQLAGLGGSMDKSAGAFLGVLADVQASGAGQELKAAGMSAKELAEITQLSLMNQRGLNLSDAQAKAAARDSAIGLATELDKVASITGKSRKQQEEALQQQMQRAEIEATIALKGPEYGKVFGETVAGLGKFGPAVQQVMGDIATGGPKTAQQMQLYTALGPAAVSLEKLNRALESGDKVAIASARQEADAALASRANSKEFAMDVKTMAGSFGPLSQAMSEMYHQMYTGGKAIEGAQAELAKQKKVDVSTISTDEAQKYLDEQYRLKTKGLKLDKNGKEVVNEDAVVGRSINQIDNLGKVVGGVIATGFQKLNTETGHLVNTNLPNLNAQLKALGSPDQLTTAVGNKFKSTINNAASAIGVNKPEVTVKPGTEGGAGKPIPKTPKQHEEGTKTVWGDWFPKEFTKGMLVKVDPNEAIVPRNKSMEFVRDTMPELFEKQLNASSSQSKMPGISKAEGQIKTPDMSGLREMLAGLKTAMTEATAPKAAAPAPTEAPAPKAETYKEDLQLKDLKTELIQLNTSMEKLVRLNTDSLDALFKGNRIAKNSTDNRLA